MQRPTCSGVSSSRTPAASSTSAEPDLEETERLPCLATRAPAAAVTKALAVEMLKVPRESPPVPQVSTRYCGSAATLVASSRITWAAAAISATVSPFIRSPTRKPPIWAGVAPPVMMVRITAAISSPERSPRLMTRLIACGSSMFDSQKSPGRFLIKMVTCFRGSSSEADGRAR
jgi:hypothetical protein